MNARSLAQVLLLSLAVSTRLWAAGSSEAVASPPPSRALSGFAVVELFASSGCSSCLPAEHALAALRKRAEKFGEQVYALTWLPPFSTMSAAERQRQYAVALSSPPATPQTIVNGTTIVPEAGNEAMLGRLVAAELARPADAALTVAIHFAPSVGRLTVHVSVEPVRKNTEVLLALVESHGAQEADVVRGYAQLPSHGGTAELAVPGGMKLSNVRVGAFVQDDGSMRILGANESMPLTRLSLPSSTVSGAIVSNRGAGLPRVLVEACSDTLCIPIKSDEQGRFTLPEVPSGSYTVKFYPSGSPTGTPLSLPLVVEKGEQVTLPAVVAGR